MSLKSGFYNAVEVSAGVYDRVYSADEYTNFYSAFLKDGVRRSGADDFKCIANGLVISINAGFAICGSKWIHNDTVYSLPAVTPPTGQYSRIDGVFLHVDTNEVTRAASFVYRQGTPAATPEPPAKETETGIFELCLCYVNVAPNASVVSITDKRADSAVCGWVTSPVGYDDYFNDFDAAINEWIESSETEFETWFANVRETLAVATLFKQYTQYIQTTETTTTATISIVQYDPTGVDILDVFVNGMRLIAGIDYTVADRTITFAVPLIAGAEILIVVYKSIDGTGLGSVSDEVTQLQEDVAGLQTDVAELNELFVIETKNKGSGGSIAANTVGEYVFDITKNGYTPVGIMTINISNSTGIYGLAISSYSFSRNTQTNANLANITISNYTTSTKKFDNIYIRVLYQKTT